MAGGQWTVQNKVRPGVYINFKAQHKALNSVGERGTVAFPVSLPWGATEQVIELDHRTFLEDAQKLLGFRATDERIRHIAAATSHASTVLLYRLGGTDAKKATATIGELTATAKWGGERGNDLRIVVQQDIDEQDVLQVVTLLGMDEVDRQLVKTVEQLVDNAFVDWTGTGELTVTAGISLSGGTGGTQVGADFAAALASFENYNFNVLGIPQTDVSSKQIATAYMKRLRDEEGKKVIAVVSNYPDADYEGIVSLHNGIETSDGLQVPASVLVWEVAGMQAAASITESLTYTAIPNGVAAYPRLNQAETIAALKAGELVLTSLNGRAVIEQDINTLTSFSADRSKPFGKNRVVRTLDTIANDIKELFDRYYIGKVANDKDGRALLFTEISSYMQKLDDLGAIQNFAYQTDVQVDAGENSDAVVVQLYVQPVDSVEKIYMNVEVV
ncbi:phage tail sheath family protein [Paenibacillus yanchengensis]|uniref:Phage tail sheath family protein n=1 Tax=Paenibacillus yanchengensis TaxID=2035833 RepID=A0ABW4YNK3_9BACL